MIIDIPQSNTIRALEIRNTFIGHKLSPTFTVGNDDWQL
jgi:hypothetical protein